MLNVFRNVKVAGGEIPLDWRYIRWSEGDPQPPISMLLYVPGTDDPIAGKSISSGSLTSHPVPIYGYSNVTLYFEADKGGTVEIQILTPSEAWYTYDIISYSANTLLKYKIQHDGLLARLIYTPSVYPATILEGSVVMT